MTISIYMENSINNPDKASTQSRLLEYEYFNLTHCSKLYSSNKTSISESRLNHMICIEGLNSTFGGIWQEDESHILVVDFNRCVNTTDFNECLPQDEINIMLNRLYINFYMQDNKINPKNHVNPISNYVKQFYFLADMNQIKEFELFYRTVTIEIDYGWIFSNSKIINTLEVDRFTFDNKIYGDVKDSYFASLWIYGTPEVKIIERTYTKVSDLIANLGGIMEIFIVLSHLIINHVNSLSSNIILMNQLYDFKELESSNYENHFDNINKSKFSKSNSVITENKGNIINRELQEKTNNYIRKLTQ